MAVVNVYCFDLLVRINWHQMGGIFQIHVSQIRPYSVAQNKIEAIAVTISIVRFKPNKRIKPNRSSWENKLVLAGLRHTISDNLINETDHTQ
jgi:hypothetical protein